MNSLSPIFTLLAPLALGAPVPTTNPAPLVGNWGTEHVVCRPISLRATHLDGFLGAHVKANNQAGLPAGIETLIPKAVEARACGEEPPAGCKRLATDSDFYKWLEGACYAIAYGGTTDTVKTAVDRYADMLVRLQEPDGYLGTRLSPAHPFDERVRHDLYVAGHFMEAAVAHAEATGRGDLLRVAERLADFYRVALERGHPYFKLVGQEHPCIELALVRLYRATGERRFLDFSAALTRMAEWGPRLADVRAGASRRHAVRLCYQLVGAAELYMESGDESSYRFLPSLWDELVTTRMYVTGGIGYNEVVPENAYDLPQTIATRENRDIAETCASVSLMMYAWRMHAITGDSRTFDIIETILYNHYLGALAQDHLGIFYYNPLKRVGDLSKRTDHGGNPVQRTRLPELHSTTCCMPNAWRFFAQLPEYVFSTREGGICVNLYSTATTTHVLPDGTAVKLQMRTAYPREGQVEIAVETSRLAGFSLDLRIPGWCDGASVKVGQEAPAGASPGTYHRIRREWRSGDRILLDLPPKPAVLFGDPRVDANRGQVAFRRGPLIYCLEKQDAAGLDLERAVVLLDPRDASRSVTDEFDPRIGLPVLRVRAAQTTPGTAGSARDVRLVPFFFRGSRAPETRWLTWIPYQSAPSGDGGSSHPGS